MPTISRNAITYANGNFISLNTNGQISYSTDGANWANANIGSTQSLNAAAYGSPYYVIVGDYGTLVYSSNLISWVAVTLPSTVDMKHVMYGNAKFVAVGSSGTILYSTNGTTWTTATSGTTNNLVKVRYLNSKWVVIGANGTMLSSTDGITWAAGVTASMDTRPLYGIAYKAGMTYPYTAGKKVSTDGVTWISLYSNSITTNNIPLSSGTAAASTTDAFFGYISSAPWGFICSGRGDLGVPYYGAYYGWTSYSTNGSTFTYPASGSVAGNYYPCMDLPELNGSTFRCGYWDGTNGYITNLGIWPGGYNVGPGNGINDVNYNIATGNTPTGYSFYWPSPWNYIRGGRFTPYNSDVSFEILTGAYGNGYYMLIATNYSTPTSPIDKVFRSTTFSLSYSTTYVASDWNFLSTTATFPAGTVKWPVEIGKWSMSTSYGMLQYGMAFGAGKFVVVGPRRTANTGTVVNGAGTKYFTVVYSADNGVTWSEYVHTASAGYDVGGRVAGSANEIVMSAKWYNSGAPGYVLRTTDCVNYTPYFTGYSSPINELKYLNGYFYTMTDQYFNSIIKVN